jgi:hypothetical protein
MKLIQRLVAILSIILACVVVGILLVLPTKHAQAQSNSVPSVELGNSIPDNPKHNTPPKTPEEEFGQFAWETFVALNWPADCSNGSPKEEKIGQDPDAPRVWEFYQFPEDIFKPNGAEPNHQPVVPPQCSGDSQPVARNLRLTEFASNSILKPANLWSNADLRTLLPSHKPLVDRAGNYILNEARMNPIEVNQIVNKGWYAAKNLAQFDNKFDNEGNPFELMCSNKQIYPSNLHSKVPCSGNDFEGVIELKAAWMVFPDPVPDQRKSKYYTTTRTFDVETVNGEKKSVTVPVGLVGFHIVHKTSKNGWIWSTFEHKDNAPDDKDKKQPPMDHYNLFDKSCTGNCGENEPHAKEPYRWRDEFPHAVTTMNEQQTPSQITRLVPIPNLIAKLNSTWQNKLEAVPGASVWQNYQLIGVQWLENPFVPYETNGNLRGVKPPKLANVTLEPYVQKSDLGSSCIACHSLAALPPRPEFPPDLKNVTCATENLKNSTCADFSFLIGHAK